MNKYFELIIRELEDRRGYISNAMIQGAAKEYSEYRNMCGEIQGLSSAIQTVTDLVRKLEQTDDE
jgi:hypothetical protein